MVARVLWEHEVAGSNPVIPINLVMENKMHDSNSACEVQSTDSVMVLMSYDQMADIIAYAIFPIVAIIIIFTVGAGLYSWVKSKFKRG